MIHYFKDLKAKKSYLKIKKNIIVNNHKKDLLNDIIILILKNGLA